MANESQVRTTPSSASAEIIATPGKWHRGKLIGVALLFLGFGIACIYHGFFVYPRQNAEFVAAEKDPTLPLPHPGFDIPMNKGFAVILPPLALLLIGRALYMSRGEYRLANNVLHIPGHPAIPLEAITRLDKRRWDRKGIIEIDYELADAKPARCRLDDFYYDRDRTDEIVDRIEAFVKAA